MPLAQRYTVDERIERQAGFCTAMGSSLGGSMLKAAARDFRSRGPVRTLFDEHPEVASPARVGIRLLAAFHASALNFDAPALASHLPSCGGDGDAGAAWLAAREYLSQNVARIATLCERVPQTNEVARATPLLGGLLIAAAHAKLPVALFEIGASAGLNTRLDTYRYEGDGWSWGDPASPLVLRNRERFGRPTSLDAPLRVALRAACDLSPLDVASDEDRNHLRSFVWPDQLERFRRLDDACAAASRTPLAIERADAIEWASRRVRPQAGTLTVLMHSVVTYYLTQIQRDELQAIVARNFAEAGVRAPFAWLRMEVTGDGGFTRLALSSSDDRLVARSDGHGQGLTWSGVA